MASTADREVSLLENGRVVAEGRLSLNGPASALGAHVFILKSAHQDARGLSWQVISHHQEAGAPLSSSASLIAVLRADGDFQRAMKARMHPGMVLILTDIPLHRDRRSGEDFVIIANL